MTHNFGFYQRLVAVHQEVSANVFKRLNYVWLAHPERQTFRGIAFHTDQSEFAYVDPGLSLQQEFAVAFRNNRQDITFPAILDFFTQNSSGIVLWAHFNFAF